MHNKFITGQPAFWCFLPLCKHQCLRILFLRTDTALAVTEPWSHRKFTGRCQLGVAVKKKGWQILFLAAHLCVKKQVCHSVNVLFPQRNYFPHYNMLTALHGWFHTWLLQMMLQVVQSLSDTRDKNLPAGVKTQAVFIRVSISLKALEQIWHICRQ